MIHDHIVVEAVHLANEVIEFLLKCGGVYKYYDREMHEVIISCTATRQYIIYRDECGKIETFCGYWCTDDEGLQDVQENLMPKKLCGGNRLYVVEFASRVPANMRRIVRDLRKLPIEGVMWRSHGKDIKHFPKQRGGI